MAQKHGSLRAHIQDVWYGAKAWKLKSVICCMYNMTQSWQLKSLDMRVLKPT